MTIIMGLTYIGGAVIAADTLRHDAIDGLPAGKTDKTRVLSSRIVGAKAGFGPDADWVWDEVISSGISTIGPAEVASRLKVIGKAAYSQCKQESDRLWVEDPGLYFLIAGLEPDNKPSIHWLNFKLDDFGGTQEIGCALSFGSRPATCENGVNHAKRLLHTKGDSELFLPCDTWVRNFTADERRYAQHAIGFPVNLNIVSPDRVSQYIIEMSGEPHPSALVRIG